MSLQIRRFSIDIRSLVASQLLDIAKSSRPYLSALEIMCCIIKLNAPSFIRKPVVDFLFVIIEVFFAIAVTAERATGENRLEIAVLEWGGSL